MSDDINDGDVIYNGVVFRSNPDGSIASARAAAESDFNKVEIKKAPFTKSQARSFIEDIIEVYKKHNLSLAPEPHSGFNVELLSEDNIDYLKASGLGLGIYHYLDGKKAWNIFEDAKDVDDISAIKEEKKL